MKREESRRPIKRHVGAHDYPWRKDAEGRPLCRWCGVVVTPPRRSWCSDACVEAYRMVADPAFVRAQVKARDKGVCATCRVDAEEVRVRYMRLYRRCNDAQLGETRTDYVSRNRRRELRKSRLYRWARAAGWPTDPCRDWWEADHIVPVVEGGGCCGLENYRTLCVPCHKRETAALAKRRAQERRRAKRAADPQMVLLEEESR